MSYEEIFYSTPILKPIANINLWIQDYSTEAYMSRVIFGFLFYIVLSYICSRELVKEKEKMEPWVEGKMRISPVEVVKVSICYVEFFIKWVYKIICKLKIVIPIALVLFSAIVITLILVV